MKMGYLLGGVIVAAGVVAMFGGSFSRERPRAEPMASSAPPLPSPTAESPAAGLVEGAALEVHDVPGYTYIRVGEAGSEGTWTAVATAGVKVGERVSVRSETVMNNFESKTLKRSFDSIHFGSLATGESAGALPPGHAPTAGALPPGHAPTAGALPPGHPPSAASAGPSAVGAVGKATGPNARTIAEVFAEKQALSAKKIRVRGRVVKVTSGILGKNFLHLQDGTGSEQTKDHDLTVTTAEEVARDQTVTFEGTLVLDKDLGAGYRYDALLEDAVVVK
jgi:hypothetical protein